MSDYFFIMPSFTRGAGRVLDLGAGLQKGSYLLSDTGDEADLRALVSDWAAVDRDLAIAANRIVHKLHEQKEQESEPAR
jgi:hypothetical protein